MSAAEDQADVEKVLAGNTSAFEGIVRRWQTPLINLAFRFCRDRSRSEELAQEAFLRVFRSLGKWRREAAFSTWLFAVATNLYRSDLRRFPANTISFDDWEELVHRRAHNERNESSHVNRTLHDAVLALPPKYRDALILFYFHDMDISAAAKSLALPDGTVKARLSRGRQLLRTKLQNISAAARLKATQ